MHHKINDTCRVTDRKEMVVTVQNKRKMERKGSYQVKRNC